MNAQECLAVLDDFVKDYDVDWKQPCNAALLRQARTFVASLIDEVERLRRQDKEAQEFVSEVVEKRDAALRRVAELELEIRLLHGDGT